MVSNKDMTEETSVVSSEVKKGPDYGFVWIHPDVRETETDAKIYLKKNPTMAINLGDGKGWRYGHKYNFGPEDKKLIEKPIIKKQKRTSLQSGASKKKFVKQPEIKTSGLSWNEKKEILSKIIIERYGNIPDIMTFKTIPLKKGSNNDNPEGTRLLIYVDGLERQRHYDYKGEFRINRFWKQVDKLVNDK